MFLFKMKTCKVLSILTSFIKKIYLMLEQSIKETKDVNSKRILIANKNKIKKVFEKELAERKQEIEDSEKLLDNL